MSRFPRVGLGIGLVLVLGSCGDESLPMPRVLPPMGTGDTTSPGVSPQPRPMADRDAGSNDSSDPSEADAGAFDTCPQDCDDRNPCTRDERRSDEGDCSRQCRHTLMTEFIDDDRCCPLDADATTDSDCSPVCGNGALDPGEDCDSGELCSKDCKVLLDASLVHRYSFEGTGTTVSDSVGSSNGSVVNGRLNGQGGAVLGGSAGEYVNLPNGLISSLRDVTIEAWVTWSGGPARQRVFDFGMSTAGEDGNPGEGTSFFMLEPTNSNQRLATYMNFTSAVDIAQNQSVEGPAALSTGSMHQLAVTFDASDTRTLSLYLDGVRQSALPDVTGNLSQIDDRNAWIGRANYDEALFRGTIHEFRIYSRALSAAALMRSSQAGPDPGAE